MSSKTINKLSQDNLVNLTESLINSLVDRDPVSNDILEGFLSDFAINFKDNVDKNDILLKDDIISIFLYAEKSIKNILIEPKYKKVKVDKFVDKSRLKKTTPKTINWIGRQPGRTIREKMMNVDKVLSQVVVDTYDIKENQVTVFVLKILYKAFKEKEEYLKKLDIKEKSEFLSAFKSLILEKEKSNINEAREIYHVMPNNTLIGHKSYSIIWKTMKKLLKIDSEREIKAYSLGSRLVKGIFLALASKFAAFENLANIEEYIYVKDGMDYRELEHISGEERNKKQGDIFFKLLGREAAGIPRIQFIIDKESKSPKKVTFIQLPKQIRIEIEDIKNLISKKENTNTKIIYTIKFDIDKFKESANENILFAEVDFNKKEKCNFIIKDTITIIELFNKITGNMEKLLKIKLKEKSLETIKTKDYGNLSLDFTGNEPIVVLDRQRVAKKVTNSIVKYSNTKNLERNFKTEKNSIYINHKGVTYVKDIFDDYENNDNKNALSMYFDSIKKEVEPKAKSLLLYNMPDSIEEVYQKPIKEIVNSRFNKNTFPVWRSVAGVTKAIKDNSIKLAENRAILVMDFNTTFVSTGIILMQQEKSLKEKFIIKHFQPFKEEKLGAKINEKSFMESYLNLYLDKQKILKNKELRAEFIETTIKEFSLNKVFAEKIEINRFILTSSGIESFVPIKYDEEIVKSLLKDFKSNFKKFMEIQKSKIEKFENGGKDRNIKFTYGISLCNTLNTILKNNIQEVLNEVLKNKLETKAYSILEILEGSGFYHERIESKQKTWVEHLPKLSLEVPRNHQYDTLILVGRKDQQAMDIMGQDNIIELEETLLIPKGKKEIKFPIIKEDISSNSKPIEISVKHSSFPLDRDQEVKVVIEYVYGEEDSYKIFLYPVISENAPFQKIRVSLKSEEEDREAKFVIPKIEKIVKPEDIQRHISEDNDKRDCNDRLEKEIRENIFEFEEKQNKLEYLQSNGRLIGQSAEEKYYEAISFIERVINRKSKRYVEISLRNTSSENEYLQQIFKSDAFKYIEELTRMNSGICVENEFFEYIERDLRFDGFYKKCMYYVFSAGGLTPKEISNSFLNNYENMYKNIESIKKENYWNRIKRHGLLQLLINNEERTPFEILVNDILDKKTNYVELIDDLLRVCKVDAQIIMKIFLVDGKYMGKKVIKEILEAIKQDFNDYYKKLESDEELKLSKRSGFYIKDDKLYIDQRDTPKIMKHLEMTYIILTLRVLPTFEYLKPSSEESKLLARNIRAIDRHLERDGTWKDGTSRTYDSTMEFTGIDKPESLKNVRDIVYALNLYLTGDNGANNITMNVGEIED